MKRRGVLKIILILVGSLILAQCRSPTPVAAAVEFTLGVGADADQPVIKGLVAAFSKAEAAVKSADLDALMQFYATSYNDHGLKISDVRRVWEEVYLHYRDISSSHVFTELKLIQAESVRKAYVRRGPSDLPYFTLRGTARLPFPARIGRAPFYRARSASKKDGLAAPFLFSSDRALRGTGDSPGHPPSLLALNLRRFVMKCGDFRTNEIGKVLVS